jgi:hypothetical protein
MKTDLLLLAGYGHFGILLASIQVPRVLDWRSELAGLHPFVRQLFWVYGVFIVFTIAALGTLTLMNLQALVEGDAVARSLAGFTSLFWALRLVVQVFVFDARPFLTNAWRWLGYQTLTGAFVYFTLLYGWIALV